MINAIRTKHGLNNCSNLADISIISKISASNANSRKTPVREDSQLDAHNEIIGEVDENLQELKLDENQSAARSTPVLDEDNVNLLDLGSFHADYAQHCEEQPVRSSPLRFNGSHHVVAQVENERHSPDLPDNEDKKYLNVETKVFKPIDGHHGQGYHHPHRSTYETKPPSAFQRYSCKPPISNRQYKTEPDCARNRNAQSPTGGRNYDTFGNVPITASTDQYLRKLELFKPSFPPFQGEAHKYYAWTRLMDNEMSCLLYTSDAADE